MSFLTGLERLKGRSGAYGPSILVATVLAITARFLFEHYGAPAMLMA